MDVCSGDCFFAWVSGSDRQPISINILLFPFWLDRIATLLPTVESTKQSPHTFEAVFFEYLRRPGASMLVRSGAVGDYLFILWQLLQARFQFGERDVNRTWKLDRATNPRAAIAIVNDNNICFRV